MDYLQPGVSGCPIIPVRFNVGIGGEEEGMDGRMVS